MGDLETLAAQAIQKIARNGFARRKANRMYKAVKGRPVAGEVGKQAFNLRIVAHIAVKHQSGAKVGGKFGDAFLEALAHIAECQLGTLGLAGFGDAIGNGTVGQYASDQQLLAC